MCWLVNLKMDCLMAGWFDRLMVEKKSGRRMHAKPQYVFR